MSMHHAAINISELRPYRVVVEIDDRVFIFNRWSLSPALCREGVWLWLVKYGPYEFVRIHSIDGLN